MNGSTDDGRESLRLPASPDDRAASLAAEVLREAAGQYLNEPRIPAPSDRDSTVAALERALGRRRRHEKLRQRVVPVCTFTAAAMVVLVAAWVVGSRSGERLQAQSLASLRDERAMTVLAALPADPALGGSLVRGGDAPARLALSRGMTLAPGDRLAASASTEIRLGTLEGSVLTLERASALTVVEQGGVQRFALGGGAVRAQVARLDPGQRFVIDTSDAEIEVHGTVFRVALVAADRACATTGIRTRVSVTEGVVGVRAGDEQTFVTAGEIWPKDCSAAPARTGASSAAGEEAAVPVAPESTPAGEASPSARGAGAAEHPRGLPGRAQIGPGVSATTVGGSARAPRGRAGATATVTSTVVLPSQSSSSASA